MSSFSSKVMSLGSEGPLLAAAVSRICATTGPCLQCSILTHEMDRPYLRTGILSGLSVEAGKPEGVPSPNWGDRKNMLQSSSPAWCGCSPPSTSLLNSAMFSPRLASQLKIPVSFLFGSSLSFLGLLGPIQMMVARKWMS